MNLLNRERNDSIINLEECPVNSTGNNGSHIMCSMITIPAFNHCIIKSMDLAVNLYVYN